MPTKISAELGIEPNTKAGIFYENFSSDDMEIGVVKYRNGILHLNDNKRITGIAEDF